MTAIPAEAVTAAAKAIGSTMIPNVGFLEPEFCEPLARRALEAAEPHRHPQPPAPPAPPRQELSCTSAIVERAPSWDFGKSQPPFGFTAGASPTRPAPQPAPPGAPHARPPTPPSTAAS